ncbi:MAG: hypothetical protein AAFZ15_25065 [Bacteroidota bacterium]
MIYKIYQVLLILFVSATIQAQETIQPKQMDTNLGIVYNQEFALGMRLHTNGFAVGATFGKLKTYYLTKYFHFEIGELKHEKEFRQSFDTPTPIQGRISRAFKYGKQNNLYVLRGAMGAKRYFSEKAKHKGVAFGISYEGGATLGFLKPYYLELRAGDGRASVSTKYSEENADRFLDIFAIQGASGWSKGFSELSLLPGVHGKFAVHFDWGAYDEYLKSIEAGLMVDFFSRQAPIMVERNNVENNQLFLNLFIHLQFGKRW